MIRITIQTYENENSKGLHKVNLTDLLSVINYKGQGPRTFEIKHLKNIEPHTTIQEAVDNGNISMIRVTPDANSGSSGSSDASNYSLDTSNFDNLLSSNDDTVQKALETLDDITINDMNKTLYLCNVVRGNGTETFNDGDVFGVVREGNSVISSEYVDRVGSFVINENFTTETPSDSFLPTNDLYLVVPKTGYYRVSLNVYSPNANNGRLMVMKKNTDKCVCSVKLDDTNNNRNTCSTNIVLLAENSKMYFKSEGTITIYTDKPSHTFLEMEKLGHFRLSSGIIFDEMIFNDNFEGNENNNNGFIYINGEEFDEMLINNDFHNNMYSISGFDTFDEIIYNDNFGNYEDTNNGFDYSNNLVNTTGEEFDEMLMNNNFQGNENHSNDIEY